jgi:hypothetical protein
MAPTFCQDYLDKETTYRQLAGHGRIEELVFFGEQIRDYEAVVGG